MDIINSMLFFFVLYIKIVKHVNLTNYYNLIYEYKNDCLKASVVYNKQFYQEDTVNSGKNIFFKISFIPFGNINTPNIND